MLSQLHWSSSLSEIRPLFPTFSLSTLLSLILSPLLPFPSLHCPIISLPPSFSLSSHMSTAYSHPTGAALHTWTIDDVGDFLTHLGYEAYLDRFVEHEIDGKALSLVKDHHLLMTLKLRLGPTLKIIENVNAVKIMEEGDED